MAVSESTRRLKSSLDDAVWTLGLAMRERFEPGIAAQLGNTWFKVVKPSQGTFARDDFASYVDCLIGANERTATYRQLFRDTAAQPWRTYGSALEQAKRARNEIAHADIRPDRRSAAALVAALADVADALSLNCADDLAALVDAIKAGHIEAAPAADPVNGAEVEELRERLSDFQHLQESLTERAAAADFEIGARDTALADTVERLTSEQAQSRKLKAELEQRTRDDAARAELRSQVADQQRAITTTQEHLAAVEAQLAAAHEERDRIAVREAEARTEAHQLRQQVAALPAVQEQLNDDDNSSQDTAADGVDNHASTAVQVADIGTAFNHKVDEILRLVERRNQALTHETAAVDGDGDFPEPGETWPYPRGTEIWTLSGSRQTLLRLSDGADATTVWYPGVVAAAIEQFLSLRPRGGRVWLDDDEDAVTYLDGQLTYLGRMTDFADQDAEPTPGTPCNPGGRKYRISRVGIYRAADEASLSKVRAPAIARKVRERLTAIRPKGGVFRVGPDGAATTYVDGTWVYAGRVSASEWFPGDIK